MLELPRKSFIQLEDHVLLSAPALVFVQLSETLPLAHLIELGFEICGTYRLVPQLTQGFLPCMPLSSVDKMKAHIRDLQGLRGKKRALQALSYVLEGSASPMESKLAVLLCLPRRLGGYGLPQPRMNYRIDIGRRLRKTASKKYYVCDLYWTESRVAVEYDSDLFHTASEHIASDASKRNALAAQGITVITVTKRQILNKQELDRVAAALAKALGMRQRNRCSNWANSQMKLRTELLDFRAT